MENKTIEILNEGQEGIYHIPVLYNMQQTMCGFVDVAHVIHKYDDHPCNCKSCIMILKSVQKMRFPKNYFKRL